MLSLRPKNLYENFEEEMLSGIQDKEISKSSERQL